MLLRMGMAKCTQRVALLVLYLLDMPEKAKQSGILFCISESAANSGLITFCARFLLSSPQGDTENNVTCTACAGTLLLEFGLLSALTRDPKYMDIAHKCAKVITLLIQDKCQLDHVKFLKDFSRQGLK
jgi:hypothetical protein